MALSDDLRDELVTIRPRADCDRLAELSGLFHAAGSVHLRGRGEVSVHLDLASSAVARRAFTLLRAVRDRARRSGPTGSGRSSARPATSCTSRAARASSQVLHEAGVLSARLGPLERPPKRVVARSCCRAAYLRGALLAAAR